MKSLFEETGGTYTLQEQAGLIHCKATITFQTSLFQPKKIGP